MWSPRSATVGASRLRADGVSIDSVGSIAGVDGRIRKKSAELPSPQCRVKIALWALHNIDLVRGTFGAQFRITLFWSPSRTKEMNAAIEALRSGTDKGEIIDRTTGRIAGIEVDIPPISILNQVDLLQVSPPELHAVEPTTGRILLRFTCMYSATLVEARIAKEQNMYSFPYDSHFLEISFRISGERGFKNVPLAPIRPEDNANPHHTHKTAGVIVESVALPDFLISPTLTVEVDEGNVVHGNIQIWRKYHYLERNVLQLNCLLQLMGFCTFALPANKLDQRLTFAVGILFAMIGLRFMVDSLIPRLEFSTVTQRNLNSSIYVVFAIVMESTLVSVIHKSGVGVLADHTADLIDGATFLIASGCLLYTYAELLQCRAAHMARRPGGLIESAKEHTMCNMM